MKSFVTVCVMLAAAMAMAQDCCEKKAEAKQGGSAQAAACGPKSKPAGGSCGQKGMSAEEEFMREAHRMAMASEGKDLCCKSTASHAVPKGGEGCCNAPGQSAKFKVFVAGAGYRYFGCEGSAAQGRKDLLAKGLKVGAVQKVTVAARVR